MNSKTITTDMIAQLLAGTGSLPSSSLGRIGRMGAMALRGGRLIFRQRKKGDDEEPELDMDSVAKLVSSMGRLKGIAMKMGQIMSYIDMAIPGDMRKALAALQTHAQPMPFEQVRGLIIDELRERGARLVADMDPAPISAASIGQVHRSRLPRDEDVAVKVQYPEVARAIRADFGPASVGTQLASLFYPNARIDRFVDEARARFLEECDYLHEAGCQDRFRELYKDHPVLFVPKVYPDYCSEKVLTTEFIEGASLGEYLETSPSQEERDRLGAALFEFYLGSLFRHQIYNCDPHPGNYLFCPGPKIAMLDHGCTRQFETRFVAKLASLTRALHRDDPGDLHTALLGLSMVREGKEYDFDMIRGFLRSFYGPMLVDEVTGVDLSQTLEMREIIKKKKQLLRFSLPGEFLFLFRIRFGLMSVLYALGARANWYRLEKSYLDEFTAAHPVLSTTPAASSA